MSTANSPSASPRAFGPLILDGSAIQKIEYRTLISTDDLTPRNLIALKDLHDMHKRHFGDGGRDFSHFIHMLELNKKRKDTLYAITIGGHGDEYFAMSGYLTIVSPDGFGAHGTVSTPYTSISTHMRKHMQKNSGNNEDIGLDLRNIRHTVASNFLREKKFISPNSTPVIAFFNEVEDSLLLTVNKHKKTLQDAETSAPRRQRHWHKVGYMAFDLPFYAELRSIDGAPPCYHYVLQAWIVGQSPSQPFGPAIPRGLLAHHITTQASVQRLHGGDPNNDPDHHKVMQHVMAKELHLPRDRTQELLILEPELDRILALDNPAIAHRQIKDLIALKCGS